MSVLKASHLRVVAGIIEKINMPSGVKLEFALQFCRHLKKNNPKFKKQKFLHACGFTKAEVERHEKRTISTD